MNKYPFNKERAMAGESVVTRDGKAAERQTMWNQPLVFISDGKGPFMVEDDGKYCGVLEDHHCDLFMLTPDPQPSAPIPFDWDKYNSGEWEVKYRNDKKPRAVYATPEARDFVIISIDDEGDVLSHLDNGMFYDSKKEHGYDLLLITKEVTRWFNLYSHIGITRVYTGMVFNTEAEAKENTNEHNGYTYIGTYSFTTKVKS